MKTICFTALLSSCVLFTAPRAAALWADRLELFAAHSIAQDDNVFRVSDSVDPAAVFGIPSLADTYRTTSFGAKLDLPISAQRVVASFAVNRQRYDRFGNLDVNGRAGEVRWLWSVGERATGELAYGEDFFLASFANVQSGIQNTTPNFLKIRNTEARAQYLLTPRWQLRAAVAKRKYFNSQIDFQTSDATIDDVGVAAMFVTRAGNEFGVRLESSSGELPNLQTVGGIGVDNSYTQQGLAALARLSVTPSSTMDIRLAQVSRDYAEFPARDFNDWVFNASYEWRPTAKFTLTAVADHDISSREQVNVGFVVLERLALRPALSLTDKLRLALSLERGERRYRGDLGFGLLGSQPAVVERIRSTGLTVTYRPTRIVTVGFDLYDETRRSTLALGDYDTRVASIDVRVAF